MAQHRVTTRRRHRKSDVVVLVYIKNTKQGLLETMFVYIFPQTSSGRNKCNVIGWNGELLPHQSQKIVEKMHW